MGKWLGTAFYILVFAAAYLYRDTLSSWMSSQPPIGYMVILATLLAMFPVMPYKLIIAALGYVYGAWWGGLICVIGSTLAGALFYAGAAYFFKAQAQRWLSGYPKLQRLSNWMEAHPFEAIVLYRLIPLFPQSVINLYAGVSSISFGVFMLASLIGKIPGVFVYAYLGTSLFKQPVLAVSVLSVYLLILGITIWVYKRMNPFYKK